jgi:hypothetical protein
MLAACKAERRRPVAPREAPRSEAVARNALLDTAFRAK